MRVSSRANKGQDTRVKLEEEQAQQPKITRTPRRTPVRQPVGNNQPMAAIVRSPVRRVLNLNLPDAPPSDDIKFTEDWSLPDNPFWRDNFYTPQDNTTQEYMEATDKLINLPASFYLVNDIETAFGVANLELNPDLVKPMKRIPLYSKLEKGDYEIAQSKSDKLILQVALNSLEII